MTDGQTRRDIAEKRVLNRLEDILDPIERELAALAEELGVTGNTLSSGHINLRADFFKNKMRQSAQAVLEAFKESASSVRDFSKEEVYEAIHAVIDTLHQRAIGDVHRVDRGSGIGAGSAISEIERARSNILERAKRDIDIWLDEFVLSSAPQKPSMLDSVQGEEVFVVMSLAEDLDALFFNAIEPAIEANGYKAYRVDREEPEGTITEDILQRITDSPLVLGDLTYERCNCYYELGYARGIGKRIILTARDDHDPRATPRPQAAPRVHFDLDAFKISYWSQDRLEALRIELDTRIRTVARGGREGAPSVLPHS